MGKIHPHIKEEDHDKIIALWHNGFGASSIGLKLAYGHHIVKKFLDAQGLKRTAKEGVKAYVKAKGACGVNTGTK